MERQCLDITRRKGEGNVPERFLKKLSCWKHIEGREEKT